MFVALLLAGMSAVLIKDDRKFRPVEGRHVASRKLIFFLSLSSLVLAFLGLAFIFNDQTPALVGGLLVLLLAAIDAIYTWRLASFEIWSTENGLKTKDAFGKEAEIKWVDVRAFSFDLFGNFLVYGSGKRVKVPLWVLGGDKILRRIQANCRSAANQELLQKAILKRDRNVGELL